MASLRWLPCGVLVVVLGCSRGLPPEVEGPVNPEGGGLTVAEVDLSMPAEKINLAALLTLPREELAQRGDEFEKQIRRQQQLRAEGNLKYTLLPNVRLPLVLPVFRESAYSKDRGISLPPYLKADGRDSAVAFHLARHGDLEAAEKLVETGDDDTLKLIRETAGEKNYPFEWTRLVALLLHGNQIALATDNKDGAKNLIHLQKQLRTVLDEKAQSGPLGAALLSRGVGTLKQAAAAWKAIRRDDLETQTNAAVASLGTLPAYTLSIPRQFDGLSNVFGTKAGPNAILAFSPNRVADLLNLYLPTAESDTCVGFADDNQKTNEILFTYLPTLVEFETPQQFGEPIEDSLVGRKEENAGPCPRRVWDFGQGKIDVTLVPRHETLGGIVRIQLPGQPRIVELSRDFGPVHLDRTFEANRRLASWTRRGATLTFTDQAAAVFGNPLKTRPVAGVIIDREQKHDLVDRIAFDFSDNVKDTSPAAGNIARPLFWTGGRPALTFGETTQSVDFLWNDGKTRYRLKFPYARDKTISLDVADASGQDSEIRAHAATAKDAADRLARLSAKTPLSVVPRTFDGFRLGMTRADFKKALPKSTQMIEREIPGGIMAALLGSPQQTAEAVAREWFGRFDNDQLTELRIRYVDLPANKPGTFIKKIDAIRQKLGAADSATVSNAAWADLPKRGTSASLSWHDDLTLLTCLQEPHGFELILRNCPPNHPAGLPLPPIEYFSRVVGNVKLGMPAEEFTKLNAQPAEAGGYMLDAAGSEKFDVILVWLANGKVSRIVARHKVPLKTEEQASRAILETWARDAGSLGWPNRQDTVNQKLQSLASRDDQTRYRLYWQDGPGGLNMFSEWKDLK